MITVITGGSTLVNVSTDTICPTLQQLINTNEAQEVVDKIEASNKEDDIRDLFCESPLPVTVNINGDLLDTVPAGNVLNVPVLNSASAEVGIITDDEVIVADGHDIIKDTAGNTLWNIDVPATNTTITVIQDTEVSINSSPFADVLAQDDLNIVVKDTTGSAVGSKIGNEWIVPGSNSRALTLVFNLNCAESAEFVTDYVGSITETSDTNIATKTFTKNGASVSMPFNVIIGDIINITITKSNPLSNAQVIITKGSFDAVSSSFATPILGGDGRYMFALAGGTQTINVIDLSNHTIINTITLPAGKNFECLVFRAINKSMYVFGNETCRVDADPSSGTFMNVYALDGTSNASTARVDGHARIRNICYDYYNDEFIADLNSGWFIKLILTGSTYTVTYLFRGNQFQLGDSRLMRMGLNKLIMSNPYYKMSMDTHLDNTDFWFWYQTYGVITYHKGYVYIDDNTSYRKINPVTQQEVASFYHGSRAGCAVAAPTGMLIYGHGYGGGALYRINLNTGIWDLAETIPGFTGNGCGKMIYSPFSNRVYMAEADGAKLHILNPDVIASPMYEASLTLDSTNQTYYRYTNYLAINKIGYE